MPKGKGPGAPYGNQNAAGPHKGYHGRTERSLQRRGEELNFKRTPSAKLVRGDKFHGSNDRLRLGQRTRVLKNKKMLKAYIGRTQFSPPTGIRELALKLHIISKGGEVNAMRNVLKLRDDRVPRATTVKKQTFVGRNSGLGLAKRTRLGKQRTRQVKGILRGALRAASMAGFHGKTILPIAWRGGDQQGRISMAAQKGNSAALKFARGYVTKLKKMSAVKFSKDYVGRTNRLGKRRRRR